MELNPKIPECQTNIEFIIQILYILDILGPEL